MTGKEVVTGILVPYMSDLAFIALLLICTLTQKLKDKRALHVWNTINEAVYIILAAMYTFGRTVS